MLTTFIITYECITQVNLKKFKALLELFLVKFDLETYYRKNIMRHDNIWGFLLRVINNLCLTFFFCEWPWMTTCLLPHLDFFTGYLKLWLLWNVKQKLSSSFLWYEKPDYISTLGYIHLIFENTDHFFYLLTANVLYAFNEPKKNPFKCVSLQHLHQQFSSSIIYCNVA